MIKYSIIIPHFNRPDLVMKTINSFKDLKNKEILIIDAMSSKDNLVKLQKNIDSLNKKMNIYFYLTKIRLNLSKARNKGLQIARGKWVYFIDDDDDARKKFIRFLNKNKLNDKYDFYRFPNIEKVDGKTKNIVSKVLPWNKKYSPQVSTYLFNKNFLEKNSLIFNTNLSYGEDVFFQMEIFNLKNIKYKYIKIFSFNYNILTNNKSLMRVEKLNPLKNLDFINKVLETDYSDKEVYAIVFLVFDYYEQFYKRNLYKNKEESIQIYRDYHKKINLKFKNWSKMFIGFKCLYIVFWWKVLKKN